MGEWKPDGTVGAQDNKGCSNYCTALLWIVPAKVEGTWKLLEGEITFKQRFQTFSGTFKSGSYTVPIKNGKLSGDLIRFSIGDANYPGRVNGDTMEGIYESGGVTTRWKTVKVGEGL
jgi:hypothetical protein